MSGHHSREEVRFGISACLLGQSVRYDGGHKSPGLPPGGAVLVYSAEDSFDDWKRKGAAVRIAGGVDMPRALSRLYIIDKSEGVARFSEVITVRSVTESRRVAQPTEEQDRLIEAARAIGANLIICETASRLVEDEDNPNMAALQAALGRIARETRAAVIVSGHPTKQAAKDNDSAIESARGGGALTMNSRYTLTLFPAEPDVVRAFEGLFPAEDVVTLARAKPTSTTRRQAPPPLSAATAPTALTSSCPTLSPSPLSKSYATPSGFSGSATVPGSNSASCTRSWKACLGLGPSHPANSGTISFRSVARNEGSTPCWASPSIAASSSVSRSWAAGAASASDSGRTPQADQQPRGQKALTGISLRSLVFPAQAWARGVGE